MNPTLPLRQLLPTLGAANEPALATPAQHAFREALREVEQLRQQVQATRRDQAEARQMYWRQVGPLASATVAARRALYAPLEHALLSNYLTRAETQQVTEVLVALARDLEARFGEDEADILARYAPPAPPPEADEPTAPPAHEQPVAAASARRPQRADAAAQATASADNALLGSTKAAYRELARRHHPDRAALADAAAQQAQTALMQRVTAAYAAGDLAALLALLAETPAPDTSDALLARYTQALARQRAHLAAQLTEMLATPQPWGGTAKQQRTRLRETKRSLRDELAYLDYVQRQLREPATLQQWLRTAPATGL